MLELIKHPNPILIEVMPEFDWNNPVMDPKDLEEAMVKLMYANNGIGLAAPQVGIRARVFTIATRNLQGVTEPFAVFNPKIIAVSDELEQGEEGCLSYPNLFVQIKRPYHVVAEFFDRDNNQCIIRFDGIDARCFQHELDHLNGICHLDIAHPFHKEKSLKQLKIHNRILKKTGTKK
jgi:peptide deformylase